MTKLQYKDYSNWEHELFDSEGMKLHKEYWMDTLGKNIPVLNMPTDFERPVLQSFEGETLYFSANKQIVNGLKKISYDSNTTLYMVLLSAFTIMLGKYSGQEDIIVGSPTAGRNHTELQNIVGMFVNTVAMRNYPKGEKSFLEFLQEVRIHTLEAFEHQDYPFDELVENLNLKRDLSRNLLFDTMFVLQNIEEKEIELDDLEFELIEFENNISKFDITLEATEDGEEIKFKLEYCTKLFTRNTMESMKEHFLNLLNEIIKNQNKKIAEIDLISSDEKRKILVDFNNTKTDYSKDITIIELFELQAVKLPENTAVIYGNEKLTYCELNGRANQIARILREKGVKPDSIVGIMIERSLEMIIGIMGILKSGGAYMPIDPNYPKDRIEYMLEDSNADILLTQEFLMSKVEFEGSVMNLNDESLYSGKKDNLEKITNSNNLAYIIYTSGSTGKPKGVMIEHFSLVNRLNWMQSKYPIGKNDIILQKTPITFDVSIWELFWWSVQGSTLCILEPEAHRNPEAIIDTINRYNVSTIHFVPSMLNVMLEYLRSENQINRITTLKRVFASGEELKKEQVSAFYEMFDGQDISLYNLYGPTEATIDVTFFDCTKDSSIKKIPIGKPINNIRLYILNQYKKITPIGIPGELYISGDGIARGYLNRKDLTEEKFILNPYESDEKMYRTGDLARWLPDGNIEFLGRIDYQVKIRGFRIELGEIESKLLENEQIKEAVVVDKEDTIGNKYLCAYLVSDRELDVSYLKKCLSKDLPDYMIPSFFVKLDKIPLTFNGKVDRKALIDFDDLFDSKEEYIAPRNKKEEILVNIWSDVLTTDKEIISVKDKFFDIGGDSIRAISLVSKINNAFDINIELVDLFKNPTIEQLNDYLTMKDKDFSHSEKNKEEEELVQLKHEIIENTLNENMNSVMEDIYPMSDIQLGMLFHSLKEEEQAIYHDQFEYQLRIKDFDINLFMRAMFLMVSKHTMLRTGFQLDKFRIPVQIVYKNPTLDIEMMDIHKLNKKEKEDCINKYLLEDRKKHFDITKPLWRQRIFQLDDETISLVIIFHHAILDGWSVASLLTELLNTYVLLKRDENYTPGKLKHSYRDFILEQMKLKNNTIIKSYWEEELKDYKRLVFDFDKKESLNFINIDYQLNSNLVEKMKRTAQSYNVSVRTLCFAAYAYMLNMTSYTDDILVGLVENNRPVCDDGDKILGCFLNTVPVRLQFGKIKTWKKMVETIDKKIIDIKSFGRLPLLEIAHAVGERTYDGNPLFDTLFNYIDFHIFNDVLEKEIGDIKNRIIVEGYESINTLFNFTVNNTFGQMHINLKYYEGILSKKQGNKYIEYFTKILEMFYSNPEGVLCKSDILSYEERSSLLNNFNNSNVGYPRNMTLVNLFEKKVECSSDNIALLYENNQLTYKELNEKANQLARVLRENGIGPDKIVAIMLERSFNMIIGILGILKAGGAYMPIDPEYPSERIQYMLEDSNTNVLLTQNIFLHKALFRKIIVNIEDEKLYNYNKDNLQSINSPNDIAYIIYTSGTTGTPKGVMIEHRNVVRLLFNDKFQFEFDESDTWTMFHSYCFDFSVWEMYGALLKGSRLVVITKTTAKDPADYLKLLKRNKVTILNTTPTAFYSLTSEEMKENEANLNLKYVIFGGEALNPVVLKPWMKKYPNIHYINMYGITETTVHVTYKEISEYEIENNISNIGKAISTSSCYVLDSNNELMPIGTAGELYVGGEGVARGYLNREELTKDRFIHNLFNSDKKLYKSGDLVKLLENGELKYLGRIDNQVKIRGHRIELGEIEYQLLKHKDIEKAVILVKNNKEENSLWAYLVTRTQLTIAEIKTHLTKTLPDYMIPSYFCNLKEIPMTSNGKVDYHKLIELGDEMVHREINTGNQYVPPKNEIEKGIAQIWSELLGVKNIGINDNFFDLGGDSIKAINVVGRINRNFNSNLKIKDLYEKETIRKIADDLEIGKISDINESIAVGRRYIEEFKEKILKENEMIKKLPSKFEEIYPLSQIQHGMVLYSKLNNDVPVYHDQYIYSYSINNLKKEIFKKALEIVVQRNSILRTVFNMTEFSEDVQIVLKDVDITFELEDLQYLTKDNQEKNIKNYMENDLKAPFQFNYDLMWRIKLFKLKENSYVMVLTSHHAILDGWSKSVFDYELFTIYKQLVDGIDYIEPKRKISYKDYVALEIAKEESDETKIFWKNMLQGYHRNKLPFSLLSNKTIKIDTSKKMEVCLDKEFLKKLEYKSRLYGCTLKEICLSAYLYLYRIITGEEDIVTGVVTHSRPELEGADEMIGCFLNTIPIRMKVGTSINIENLIKSTKNYLHQVKKHEMFLSSIASAIGEQSSMANPIFDTLFNYVDFHILSKIESNDTFNEKKLNFSIDANEMTNTLFDLEVSRTLDQLVIYIKYSSQLFLEKDIKQALELYKKILEEFCKECNETIEIGTLLTQEERNKILFEYNNTKASYSREKCLHELLEEQAKKTPNNIAITSMNEKITYKELNEKANMLAHMLIEKGIKNGDNVGLVSKRNIKMVIGMYAILKSGATYVPIEWEYPKARKQYIWNNSDVSALLVDDDYDLDFNKIIRINYEELILYSSHNPNIAKNSKNLAYIIYTSGSTGLPKGVMIEHHSAVNLVEWVNEKFNIGEEDKLLSVTSMCFDLSVYDIFGILAVGGRLVVATRDMVKDPIELQKILKDEKITLWNSVPTTMNYLTNRLEETNGIYYQNEMRLALLSGDWIPVDLPDKMKKYFKNVEVISLGGATEGTVWSIFHPIKKIRKDQVRIPYGKPIKNNYFYILDNDRNVLPRGVIGELYIGGVGVARGYINNEEKHKKAFSRNLFLKDNNEMMYRTGDYGRFLPDGEIEFLGRIDNQVKIRGYRVELGEVETHIRNNKYVKEAIVTTKEETNGTKYICAYFVADKEFNLDQLRKDISMQLPEYMMPSYFIQIKKMPLTENGKIDREALSKSEEVLQKGRIYEQPTNIIEEKLVSIWSEILKRSDIGINDNFFEIGGHSLRAITLMHKIYKELNVEMPLKEIFKRNTIKSLGSYISNQKEEKYVSIVPVEEREYYSVSSAQNTFYWLNQSSNIGTSYNMPIIVEVEGNINVKRFKETMQELVNRHEAFRTFFITVDGKPVQKILKYLELNVAVTELKENDIVDKIIKFVRPFYLDQAPLFRVELLKLEESKYVILIDMHHIISDGASINILIRDFKKLYEGSQLVELGIQYKEFSSWQQGLALAKTINKQREYWLKKLSGELPVLDLYFDYERPGIQSFDGGEVYFEIKKELKKNIERLTTQTDTTLYMILLSAYNILLSKLTGQEDILIGTATFGRGHIDLYNIIGMFSNTIVMRNFPKKDMPFTHFLSSVKETALEAYDNQDYQFGDLVGDLGVNHSKSRNPLFDVAFFLQNIEINHLEMEGLNFKPLRFENSFSKFDLTLIASEEKDSILLTFEYCTKLFKEETIQLFAKLYIDLLEQVTQHSAMYLSEIELLKDNIKTPLLNKLEKVYQSEKTLKEIFEEQAEKNSNKVAVQYGNINLTYKELNEKANQIARYLKEQGVLKNDNIILSVPSYMDRIIAMLGILKAECICVLEEPNKNGKEIESIMLQNNEFQKLDIKEGIIYYSSDTKQTKIKFTELTIYPTDNLSSTKSSGELIVIVYPVGNHEGVKINNKSIIYRVLDRIKEFKLEESSILCGNLNRNITQSLSQIFTPFYLGATLVVYEDATFLKPYQLFQKVDEDKVTLLEIELYQLKTLLESLDLGQKKIELENLDFIILSTEQIGAQIVGKFYMEYGIKLVKAYGYDECLGDVFYQELKKREEVIPNLIGEPLSHVQAFILDTNKRYVAPLAIGELYLSIDSLPDEYYNNFEMTNQKFIRNPYIDHNLLFNTGELARNLLNGKFELVGKANEAIEKGGCKVYLKQIESKLLKSKKIKDAIVISKIGEDKKIHVYCYIVGTDQLNNNELRDMILQEQEALGLDIEIFKVDKIPFTSEGVIDEAALLELGNKTKTEVKLELKMGGIENQLIELWKNILDVEEVSLDEDFFEMGGNSISAIKLELELENLGYTFEEEGVLLEYRTIKDLAEYLESL